MDEYWLSPKLLMLIQFKGEYIGNVDGNGEISDVIPVAEALPRNYSGSTIASQRKIYRKTINLIVLSIQNLMMYTSFDNLFLYFPNFAWIASKLENVKFDKSMETSRAILRESDDLFSYDKEPKWTPLEAVPIVFMMNQMRETSSGKYFDSSFKWWMEILSGNESIDGLYAKQRGKGKRFRNQYDFLIVQLSLLNDFTDDLLGIGRNKSNQSDFVEEVSDPVQALVGSGKMSLSQIMSMSKKVFPNPDGLIQSTICHIAKEIVTWQKDIAFDNQGMKWDSNDFKWSQSSYQMENLPKLGETTTDWVKRMLKSSPDPYVAYRKFIEGNHISEGKNKYSDGSFAFDAGLYKWLTVRHYLILIISGAVMPGIVEAVNQNYQSNQYVTEYIGADVVLSFSDYLSGLLPYGKEFSDTTESKRDQEILRDYMKKHKR